MNSMLSRNPFRMRATEYIEGDWNFISLFGLNALDVFDVDNMWTNIQIIRSARGGGKTSILRIFSPDSLKEIHASRSNPTVKKLHSRLKELGAFSEEGPQILGVYLSLFGNYSILEQLEIGDYKQKKLFYSLLMCRIIMATLRSVCKLKTLEFPSSLERITIRHHSEPNVSNFVSLPCTGAELYNWAEKTEQKISDIIDDESDDYTGLGMHENLASLHVIKADNIFYDNKPVAEKTLLMLDDLDRLTLSQRTDLASTLTSLRITIGLWIAERLEGLHGKELLSPDGTVGRESSKPIILERFWREHPAKFASLLMDISDRRARMRRAYNIQSLSANLLDDLGSDWDGAFEDAVREESKRIIEKFGYVQKYKIWIERCKSSTSPPSQRAEEWRKLEIAIERDKNKGQKQLFEVEPSESKDLDSKITSGMTNNARYYIRTKYKIPYYFGFKNLVKFSSSNIEQFLELSSRLFDDMISASYTRLDTRVKPKRQEFTLRKEILDKWKTIEQSIPNSQYIIPFLSNVARFCFRETNTPRASYDSVTGIAISQEDLKKIRSSNFRSSNKKYQILYDVLITCIAHNLLEIMPEARQGERGTRHFLLYLNRLLCLRFQLPLHYGGWREQDLNTLCDFVTHERPDRDKTQRLIDMEEIQV